MAVELSREDLKRLARLGAMRRLEDLRQEEAAIRGSFPELFRGGPRGRRPGAATAEGRRTARRRPRMSRAQRKAVSERMKKYWAARRKSKSRG